VAYRMALISMTLKDMS